MTDLQIIENGKIDLTQIPKGLWDAWIDTLVKDVTEMVEAEKSNALV